MQHIAHRLAFTPRWRIAGALTISLLATVMGLTGCEQMSGAVAHGWQGVEYENTYLSTTSPLGAQALRNWEQMDVDVRKFLERNRRPDVVHSKFQEVTFFYLQEGIQVRCIRPSVGMRTQIEPSKIPEPLYGSLRTRFQTR